MARANTGNWSPEFSKPGSALDWWRSEHPLAASSRKGSRAQPADGRKATSRQGAMGLLSFLLKEPGAHSPTKTRSPTDTKDEPPPLEQPPSTGRTTSLGRKVEKPADDSVAGPSGQKERVRHDRKHTNK